MDLTPKQIVHELNKYIIGQDEAKKAVAIALRNRYRRSMLSPELQEEITPKNIIMKGPTGVGKTEIARRLAKLVKAPFLKVEATKYTEVGYVGRDVESMVRDLAECAIRLVKEEKTAEVSFKATATAERKIAKVLSEAKKSERGDTAKEIFEKQLADAKARFKSAFDGIENAQIIKSQYNRFALRFKYPLFIFLCLLVIAALIVVQVVLSQFDPLYIVCECIIIAALTAFMALLAASS